MTNKKIKEEFKKIWLKWHGCGQKQCEGCEYDFDFEWQEVSKLFDEARKEERERIKRELIKTKIIDFKLDKIIENMGGAPLGNRSTK